MNDAVRTQKANRTHHAPCANVCNRRVQTEHRVKADVLSELHVRTVSTPCLRLVRRAVHVFICWPGFLVASILDVLHHTMIRSDLAI
jgi:hypothetical protein